jgi:hypothetical protein
MSEIKPELFPEIVESLNLAYGEENWSLEQFGSRSIIIIKYDEIEISNSNDNRHTIKELYVWVYIDVQTGRLTSYELFGMRTYLTVEEALAQYNHSHLSWNQIGREGTFCLGSTEIRALLYECYEVYDHDKLTLLFYFINNFVNWESLEGGPYSRIVNIGKAGREVGLPSTSLSSYQEALEGYLSNKYVPMLSYNDSNHEFEVVINDTFVDQIKELPDILLLRYDTQSSDYILEDRIEHTLFARTTHITNNNRYTRNPSFKGERLSVIIDMDTKPERQVIDNPYIVDRPHPYALKHVAIEVAKKVNKNYLFKQIELV